MNTASDVCRNNCNGQAGNDGSCCKVEDRNYIIGPIVDYEEFLSNLSKKFNRKVEFSEVLYTYEEGSRLFPDREHWNKRSSYPSIKIDWRKASNPCMFYSEELKNCLIYEERPLSCRAYLCEHLKTLFNYEIITKE